MIVDCQDRPEEAFELKRIRSSQEKGPTSGKRWASLVMDAMNELSHIFQPLTADLCLSCYHKDSGFEDWDVEPTKPFWQLRESNIPEKVYTSEYLIKTIFNDVTEINKKSVVNWVENALKQESPRPDIDTVNIETLNFRTVRARIINEKPFRGKDTFVVDHFRVGRYKYPLRRIDEELWVYSPLPETYTKPAFRVRTDRSAGTFALDIYWNWWTSISLKDKDTLEQAMLNLISKGQWQLHFLDKYLKMPKLEDLVVDSIIG